MLRSGMPARGFVGGSRAKSLRQCSGLRLCRPARQSRLGVTAFKDWFAAFAAPKDPQPQQPSQAPSSEHPGATATLPLPSLPPAAAPKVAPKRDFLEARQVSLFQLFDSSDYKFDIPAYQRPYAWQTKQIYELLQDFVKAYQSRQEYFLGAIVATKAAEGAHVPYQLIDGQQRLTSMIILLAFLHGWAANHGNEVLEGRIRRMLYLDADPLEPESAGRYRLRLRDADDAFFRTNILDSFVPTQYRLAGVAATAAGATAGPPAALEADAAALPEEALAPELAPGAPGAAAALAPGAAALPLENETWWRLYENAAFLRGQLGTLVAEGLNLQDFIFHVLRNCFVVLMVARDEGASFRIFSTLNGRGMDLSVVDKLKADLLAGELSPAERSHFADAWAEMESVLGRVAFHRVFDYMRDLAAVSDPRVGDASVLDYFTRKVDDPRAVKQILQVSLDYARLLLQLRQASWASPELAAMLAETPLEREEEEEAEEQGDATARAAAVASAVQMLDGHMVQPYAHVLAPEEEGSHLEALHAQHRDWQQRDGGAAAVAVAPAAVGAGEEGETAAATAGAFLGVGQESRPDADDEQQQLPPASAVLEADTRAAAAVAAEEEEAEKVEAEEDVLVLQFDGFAPRTAANVVGEATAVPSFGEAACPAAATESDGATTIAAGLVSGASPNLTAADSDHPTPAGTTPADLPAEALAEASTAFSPEQPQPADLVEPQVAGAGMDAAAAAMEFQGQQHADLLQQQTETPADEADQVASARGELQQLVEGAAASLTHGSVAADAAAAPLLVEAAAFAETAEGARQLAEQAVAAAGPQAETEEAAAGTEVATDEAAAMQEAETEEEWEAVPEAVAAVLVSKRQRQAALLAELDARSRHLNLFSDEAWLPPLLEFFYQTDSLEQRVAFMKSAEALQLLLELQADPAARAARWGQVTQALLQRPFSPEAVLGALRLSDREREAFRARLDSKDLYDTVDQRTLRHLLVRAEPSSVAEQLSGGMSSLLVEKIAPQTAPEGSLWRKTRITSPCDPQSAWPEPWVAASTPTPATPSVEAPASVATASATAPRYEVKYWYEVQRLNWHGKLGNLVLLPATVASAVPAAADYDAKVALWRRAGVAGRLPGFTWPVVDGRGRYGRFKFCYEECRQRHEDMLERLIEVFEL